MTRTLTLDGRADAELRTAIDIIVRGGIIGVPTETVYGLAADAGNEDALRKIFAAKGRPESHPLILHVADVDSARRVANPWPHAAEVLARAFWPGPLTLLVNRSSEISKVVTGGRDTVAVRVPSHAVFARLLAGLAERGCVGLAAPSANKFGSVSPTSARHVLADLDGLIDAVLDGGECSVGVESTIVDCTLAVPRLLRPGGVAAESVRAALVAEGFGFDDGSDVGHTEAIAPGMLPSHYAPRARVETFADIAELADRRDQLVRQAVNVEILPHPEDLYEYSKRLYASLRECDARGANVILALLPPEEGLGRAIRDRLTKAAADR